MTEIDTTSLAVLPPEAVARLSGLELMQAMISGDLALPPVTAHTGQRLVEAEEGRVVWEACPPETFLNPLGTVHGGWALTVIDSALACAVHSALPAGQAYTTVEVKANLTRGPQPGAVYRCEGRLLNLGRRIGTAEAKMTDAEGRLVAFGTTTCMIL